MIFPHLVNQLMMRMRECSNEEENGKERSDTPWPSPFCLSAAVWSPGGATLSSTLCWWMRFCRTWDVHITICRDSRKAKNTLTGLLWYRSTIERDTVRCSDMTLQNRDKGRWSGNPAMHWSRWWRVKQRYRLIRSTSYNREMQSSLGPLVKVSMPVDYIRIHLVGCRGCIPITWVGTRLKL